MSHPNETNGNGSLLDVALETMSRLALETRVRELERENAALKLDVAALQVHVTRDAALSQALFVAGIPTDRQEEEELRATTKSISQVLA